MLFWPVNAAVQERSELLINPMSSLLHLVLLVDKQLMPIQFTLAWEIQNLMTNSEVLHVQSQWI